MVCEHHIFDNLSQNVLPAVLVIVAAVARLHSEIFETF